MPASWGSNGTRHVRRAVTPEAALFAGEATAAISRSSIGDLTILDGHTPLVGDVVAGVVRIERPDDTVDAYVVHGGFFQVETRPGRSRGSRRGRHRDDAVDAGHGARGDRRTRQQHRRGAGGRGQAGGVRTAERARVT